MSPQPRAINLKTVSRSDTAQFLRAIFDGLIYDGFRFPTDGVEGCIGGFCISKSLDVIIPGSRQRVAVHLNFKCTPGEYAADRLAQGSYARLNLAICHFHLTARTAAWQGLINNAGNSKLTAEESIHINRNTDWGRSANVTALAGSLGVTNKTLLDQLTKIEGYTQNYMDVAVKGMKAAIIRTVSINAGQCDVTWDSSDSTFLSLRRG